MRWETSAGSCGRIHAADLDIEQYSAGVNCGTADDRKAGIGLIQYLLRIHHSDREPDELFLASDERYPVPDVSNRESGATQSHFSFRRVVHNNHSISLCGYAGGLGRIWEEIAANK